jgi:hypothetical protein
VCQGIGPNGLQYGAVSLAVALTEVELLVLDVRAGLIHVVELADRAREISRIYIM